MGLNNNLEKMVVQDQVHLHLDASTCFACSRCVCSESGKEMFGRLGLEMSSLCIPGTPEHVEDC